MFPSPYFNLKIGDKRYQKCIKFNPKFSLNLHFNKKLTYKKCWKTYQFYSKAFFKFILKFFEIKKCIFKNILTWVSKISKSEITKKKKKRKPIRTREQNEVKILSEHLLLKINHFIKNTFIQNLYNFGLNDEKLAK